MAEFESDAEIEEFIGTLARGLDDFRELIGSGRISGTRGTRGESYLQRLDARNAGDLSRRVTEAAERSAQAAETSAAEADRSATASERSASSAERSENIARSVARSARISWGIAAVALLIALAGLLWRR